MDDGLAMKPESRARTKRDMPIARLLSISFALVTGLSILAVLSLTVVANVRNTFSLLNTRSMETVESLTLLIDAYLEPVELTVRSLAGQISKGELSLSDEDGFGEVLHGAIAANRMVVVIETYDLDYNVRGVFRQGPLFGRSDRSTIQNPEIREGIKLIPKDGRPHWGTLIEENGVVHANVGQALVVGGEHVGHLIAAVPLPRMSALVRQISRERSGTAFILDGGDRVLAHPNLAPPPPPEGSPESSLVAEEYTPEAGAQPPPGGSSDMAGRGLGQQERPPATVPLAEFDDPVLVAYPKRDTGDDLFEAAAEAGVEVSTVEIGDETYIMMTTAIGSYADRPWIVGVYFPGEDVSDEIRRLFGSTMVGIGFLAIGTLIAFWIGRRIGKLVADLNGMAVSVSKLDFDHVKPIPPSRFREFNQTASVLSSMVSTLKAFAAYVPRRLVSRLIEWGVDEAARSHERVLTVMFTDVAGFTAQSERMTAAETASYLNELFSILCAEVEANSGTVDKFLGDGMMAFWGAPDPLDDHAERACAAASAMAKAITSNNERRRAIGEPPVRLRIGLHTGPVVVGNIGARDRMNYTIVGDTVNTGQRIEELGKVVAPDAECIVLMSVETHACLPETVGTTQLSSYRVPGREAAIQVYQLDI